MVMCSRCGRDAVMFCANCEKALCESHTYQGRYCSPECFNTHSRAGGKAAISHEEEIKKRNQLLVIGLAAAAVVLFCIAFFVITLFGA